MKWADPAKAASFEKALSPQTRAILIELIPATGGIADIGAIAAIARNARVPLIVDNTLATPFLIRPFDYGADIIVHSAAKFLGSHESLTGGIIVDGGRFSWIGDARYPKLSLPRPEYGGEVLRRNFWQFRLRQRLPHARPA